MKIQHEFHERTKKKFQWLGHNICSDLEDLCNGKIIVMVDWDDFFCWLNNKRTAEDIIPKDKRKVEYLIHTLADYIYTDNKYDELDDFVDIPVLPKHKKLKDEEKLSRLQSLDKSEIEKYIKETWEKRVIEKCGIPYEVHKKRRTAVGQTKFPNDYRSQSKSNKEFVYNLKEILRKYTEIEVADK